MRAGNIQPSSRTYCERISTSVCLMSNPRVHSGQNRLPSFSHSVTSGINIALFGDSTYWPLIVISFLASSRLTSTKRCKQTLVKFFKIEIILLLTLFKS